MSLKRFQGNHTGKCDLLEREALLDAHYTFCRSGLIHLRTSYLLNSPFYVLQMSDSDCQNDENVVDFERGLGKSLVMVRATLPLEIRRPLWCLEL